jgi:hypothetical protein
MTARTDPLIGDAANIVDGDDCRPPCVRLNIAVGGDGQRHHSVERGLRIITELSRHPGANPVEESPVTPVRDVHVPFSRPRPRIGLPVVSRMRPQQRPHILSLPIPPKLLAVPCGLDFINPVSQGNQGRVSIPEQWLSNFVAHEDLEGL